MGALNIGVTGLRAAQVGMDVTSHNIANVNTPNFQRQIVQLQDVVYNSGSPKIPSGAGVTVASINNVNDPLLMRTYPTALSDSEEYNKLASLAKPFDGLLNNPALNLSQAMQDTFNAFQDVADTPTSIPIRQNAINTAQNFVDKSNSLMGELNSLKDSLTSEFKISAESINSLSSSIAEMNEQIQRVGSNSSAGLISQRDAMTFELSKLTGVEISSDKQRITTTSGKLLVSGNTSTEIKPEDIAQISGGSIGGTNKFITTMLNPAINKLPEAINHVATEINAQAVKGYDMNGELGVPIFNVSDTKLSNFSMNITDPKTLGASTTNNGIGDGTNAQNISDLRNKLFGGQTLQKEYAGIISNFDNKVKNYSDMSNMYQGISTGIENKIKSISGVNLDEEAANLLKYQQMYQANAQVIKTQNEMFGTLINMVA